MLRGSHKIGANSFSKMLLMLSEPQLRFAGRLAMILLISSLELGAKNKLSEFFCNTFKYMEIDLVGFGTLLAKFLPTVTKCLASVFAI